MPNRNQPIPAPVVRRLSLYLRRLDYLANQGVEKVSSRSLAESLSLTDAQVRKDLGYFGQFGRAGVGYLVGPLVEELKRILGTDKVWPVVLVGAGDLGRALLRYKGFRRRGFEVVAAFDVAAAVVGRNIGGVPVLHIRELPKLAARHGVKLAILAVPTEAAQVAAEQLHAAGIRGILNFAPTAMPSPADTVVRPVDLASELEQLSFRVGQK